MNEMTAAKNEQTKKQGTEVDLVELFYMYLGHIWQIAVVLVVGVILAFSYTKIFVTPMYTSTAKIYVVSASNDSVVNLSDLQIGAQLTGDYEELLTIHPLVEDVISNLNLNMTYKQLVDMVTITTPPSTRLLYITVESPIASQAADIANEIAKLSIEYLPEIMECSPPNIADAALTPSRPSSPNTGRNTLLGALIAVLLYCGILLVKFIMDDTFKDQDDIEKYLGATPLCVIPEVNMGGKKHRSKKNDAGNYSK